MNAEEKLQKVRRLRAEYERRGDDIPKCFMYEGVLLDTGKAIEKLCEFAERDVAQSGGAS